MIMKGTPMTTTLKYELNNGYCDPKDEVKEAFFSDLYHFITKRNHEELKEMTPYEFAHSEPYIIGNFGKLYFLKEEVGGLLEHQPTSHFVGYCYQNNQYRSLLKHLIHFFALWREIERCGEEHATDFFANSWAALVDTAKFFKYTTVADLEKSVEAPSVRDERILYDLQNTPDMYHAPQIINETQLYLIPKPRKQGYEFLGWYTDSRFSGLAITTIRGQGLTEQTLYAKWGTHTYFHANDGYPTFTHIYDDFLNDFSNFIHQPITKEFRRIEGHGPVSMFCEVSGNGVLNLFFDQKHIHQKWFWLIRYLQSNYGTEKPQYPLFEFLNHAFVDEDQVRWELNSLFVSRFHVVPPITRDYSGVGIKEKIADYTNSFIYKIRYVVGEKVTFPNVSKKGFVGWYEDFDGTKGPIDDITDDRYASKTLYARWKE